VQLFDFEALEFLMERLSEFESKFIEDRSKETQEKADRNSRGYNTGTRTLKINDENDDICDDKNEEKKLDSKNS